MEQAIENAAESLLDPTVQEQEKKEEGEEKPSEDLEKQEEPRDCGPHYHPVKVKSKATTKTDIEVVMINTLVKLYSRYLAFTIFLYFLVGLSKENAEKTNNEYTLNHIYLNETLLWINIRYLCISLFGILSQKNMGIQTQYDCVNFSLTLVLSTMRLSLLYYTFAYIYPETFKICLYCWNMNETNWWKSPDEPFFTNCSPFNAFLANFYWFIVMIMDYFCIFYAIILAAILLYFFFKVGIIQYFRVMGVFIVAFIKAVTITLANYALGTMSLVPRVGNRGMPLLINPFVTQAKLNQELQGEYVTREKFLNKHKSLYKNLDIELRDCPICTAEFELESQVIQLKCAPVHVYHVGCLDQYIVAKEGAQLECAFCKADFSLEEN
mmetsp:Transcript_16473/g.27970  ORF Transcript_16473/g.27970 Transcript_16473/m.27970 type:complete len:381 (-) Transcript_16473:40-1182(-)